MEEVNCLNKSTEKQNIIFDIISYFEEQYKSKDENMIFGVYPTIISSDDHSEILEIFANGLENYHAKPFKDWMKLSDNFSEFLIQLKNSHLSKNNSCHGIFITCLSKNDVGLSKSTIDKINPIYFETGKTNHLGEEIYCLLPEYILGYIETNKEQLGRMFLNPNYRKKNLDNNIDLCFDKGVTIIVSHASNYHA